ncbi:MAG: hypothetical protein NW214_02345 [Pseudanabaenaceae cyanobacterium bins.39]|nr:hypothetical protein [Pseudanabaenaceae cyanobacterium bins.39]
MSRHFQRAFPKAFISEEYEPDLSLRPHDINGLQQSVFDGRLLYGDR